MTLSILTQRAVDAAALAVDITQILASLERAVSTANVAASIQDAIRADSNLRYFVVELDNRLSGRFGETYAGSEFTIDGARNFLGGLLYLAQAGGNPTIFLTVQDARHIVAAKAYAAHLDTLVNGFNQARVVAAA